MKTSAAHTSSHAVSPEVICDACPAPCAKVGADAATQRRAHVQSMAPNRRIIFSSIVSIDFFGESKRVQRSKSNKKIETSASRILLTSTRGAYAIVGDLVA